MIKKRFTVLALAATAFASAASAAGPSALPAQSTYTIELRGWVPVICRAEVSQTQTPTQAGEVSLGQLNEFCNNPTGYQVWVDYSPSMADATLIVDGNSIPLSDSGSTLISSSTSAAIAQHDLAIDLPQDGMSGSMSVRVVAL